MRNLNEMFPNSKGYASKRNAEVKLNSFAEMATQSTDLFVVLQRPSDGRWLPIVIMGSKSLLQPFALASNGICVTNV